MRPHGWRRLRRLHAHRARSARTVTCVEPCGPGNCAGCCRSDNTCDSLGITNNSCGQGGAACENCTTTGSFCNGLVVPRRLQRDQTTCPAPYTAVRARRDDADHAAAPEPLQRCETSTRSTVACAGGAETAACVAAVAALPARMPDVPHAVQSSRSSRTPASIACAASSVVECLPPHDGLRGRLRADELQRVPRRPPRPAASRWSTTPAGSVERCSTRAARTPTLSSGALQPFLVRELRRVASRRGRSVLRQRSLTVTDDGKREGERTCLERATTRSSFSPGFRPSRRGRCARSSCADRSGTLVHAVVRSKSLDRGGGGARCAPSRAAAAR